MLACYFNWNDLEPKFGLGLGLLPPAPTNLAPPRAEYILNQDGPARDPAPGAALGTPPYDDQNRQGMPWPVLVLGPSRTILVGASPYHDQNRAEHALASFGPGTIPDHSGGFTTI